MVEETVEKVAVGGNIQIYCNACQTEYQIVHEPVYTDSQMAKAFGGKPKAPKICPFCGSETDLEVRS